MEKGQISIDSHELPVHAAQKVQRIHEVVSMIAVEKEKLLVVLCRVHRRRLILNSELN
jgi:hypothetical protein